MTEVASAVGARTHRKSVQRRARIVCAAGAIAANGGYDAVNMRNVAERAGVSTATLYRYFPSKHHLLVATLGDWLERFDARLDFASTAAHDPFDRLRLVVQRLYTSLSDRPLLAEAMARAYAVADAAVASQVDAVRAHLIEIFVEALGDGSDSHNAIGALLSDVWAANVLAAANSRITNVEMQARMATTVRLLSQRALAPAGRA